MSLLSLAKGECNINQLAFRYYVNYHCLIMNRNCHQFCGFHPAITLRGGSSNLSRGPPLTNPSQLTLAKTPLPLLTDQTVTWSLRHRVKGHS